MRDDYFTTVHKGLRHALFEVNMLSGRTDYHDPDEVAALAGAFSQLRMALGGHSRHEDEFIFPLVSRRVPGGAQSLYDDHVRIHAHEALVGDQLDRLAAESRPQERSLLGLEVHRALQRLTAEALVHFDEEESVLMPRIWALCDDDEIAEVRAAFMATIGPEEMRFVVDHMLTAGDPGERAEIEARVAALQSSSR